MNEEIDFTKDIDFVETDINIEISKAIENKIIYRDKEAFIIDYNKLILDSDFLVKELKENPLDLINNIKKELKFKYDKNFPLKFINLDEKENISNIRVEHIGKLVKVSGILSNATESLSLVTSRKFECPACGNILKIKGSNEPERCSCGRKSGFNCIETDFVDMQELILEESLDEIDARDPKKVRVRLENELCDKKMNSTIFNGNKIEVIGIAETIPLKANKKLNEEIHQFRIKALQIKSLEDEFDSEITEEDIEEIERIAYNNPLNTLCKSLAPNIIGRDLEKKGIILAATRGTPSQKFDGRDEKDTIHMLFIGDAGQGKTDLLTAISACHYKAKYSGGEGMTAAALTATAEQDKFLGAWTLKPGLLPKCNNGLVVIDEFDKARDEAKTALHTPMENKIVTVNKASINTTLNANTTILLGANPKNSKFDITKPLVDQINLPDTLLTRMDLIFVFRDKINKSDDENVADSVLGLDIKKLENIEIIDKLLFKKYLKYVQKFKPKLNLESAKKLKDFYIKIRQKSKQNNSSGMPVVARHLKAMKRLAEANAKLRLSETVTEEDIKIATELFKKTLLKLGMEEDGTIDFAKIGPGITVKKKSKFEFILGLMKDLSKDSKQIFEEDIIQICGENNMDKMDTKDILEELRLGGQIYSPRNGLWVVL